MAETQLRLDVALQRQLRTLRLQMGRALDAMRRGAHEVRGRGRAQSFAEHRAYVPGDELRHVDWRASARSGRTQLKVFAREARGTLELVLDATASMAYVGYADAQAHASLPEGKWDQARALCYAAATLALNQNDAVGLTVWHADGRRLLQPATGAAHGRRLHLALARLAAGGDGELSSATPLLTGGPRRRRTLVVSDFLADGGRAADAAVTLARRGHVVDVVHFVHPDEAALFAAGALELRDCEKEGRWALDVGEQRSGFAARAAAHTDALAARLRTGGVRYWRHDVGAALAPTLMQLAQSRVSGR